MNSFPLNALGGHVANLAFAPVALAGNWQQVLLCTTWTCERRAPQQLVCAAVAASGRSTFRWKFFRALRIYSEEYFISNRCPNKIFIAHGKLKTLKRHQETRTTWRASKFINHKYCTRFVRIQIGGAAKSDYCGAPIWTCRTPTKENRQISEQLLMYGYVQQIRVDAENINW